MKKIVLDNQKKLDSIEKHCSYLKKKIDKHDESTLSQYFKMLGLTILILGLTMFITASVQVAPSIINLIISAVILIVMGISITFGADWLARKQNQKKNN